MKYASRPCSSIASAPGPIEPARASVGQPSERASRPTPTAVLPKALWSSSAPSPVRQRSAPSRRARQLDGLDHQVDPRLEPAAGEGDQAAAQAAGGAGARDSRMETPRSRSTIAAKCARLASSSSTIAGVAPFCGP